LTKALTVEMKTDLMISR